jgi:hypothetical protein
MSKSLLFFALGVMGMPACALSHSCTEIGCGDGATITLASTDAAWADGQYRLTLVVDAATYVCTAQAPDSTASIRRVECDAPLGTMTLAWRAVTVCEEHRDANSISQTCTMVPNRFTLEAALQGTPQQVQVTLTRDGVPLLDQSVALAYETTQPNGPDCSPSCKQASAKLDVP